jgi:hypothetical protein
MAQVAGAKRELRAPVAKKRLQLAILTVCASIPNSYSRQGTVAEDVVSIPLEIYCIYHSFFFFRADTLRTAPPICGNHR